jgi:ABC-type transport system substrate-binding protein
MAVIDWESPLAPDAAYGLLLFYVSSDKGGLNNQTNYSNDRVDELFFLARGELDDAKRDEYLAEAQQTMMEELARVPVVLWKKQLAMRDNVSGWAWYPSNMLHWYDFEKE